MQTSVNVSSEILHWVIAHVQMDSLSHQIVDYLNSWVKEEKKPTFNQVEKVSKATGIPLGYFFLEHPPKEDLPFVEYRTLDSVQLRTPSRTLIDVMHDMDLVQQWMHEYLVSKGASKVEYIGIFQKDTPYEVLAQKARDLLGLQTEWYAFSKTVEDSFTTIRKSVSTAGTVVMMSGIVGNNTHRPLSIDEFRAFTIIDEYSPLIFINSNDSTSGKLFSLVHEFSHICIGENSLFNDRYNDRQQVRKAETLCNAVAAEILVPQEIFVREWEKNIQKNEQKRVIGILANIFKCGTTVIARKAYDNGFITHELYQKVARLAVQCSTTRRRKAKEQGEGGGDYYRTMAGSIDRRFLCLLVSSVREGKTLYTDAFRLTNTNRSTFTNLIENTEYDRNE